MVCVFTFICQPHQVRLGFTCVIRHWVMCSRLGGSRAIAGHVLLYDWLHMCQQDRPQTQHACCFWLLQLVYVCWVHINVCVCPTPCQATNPNVQSVFLSGPLHNTRTYIHIYICIYLYFHKYVIHAYYIRVSFLDACLLPGKKASNTNHNAYL